MVKWYVWMTKTITIKKDRQTGNHYDFLNLRSYCMHYVFYVNCIFPYVFKRRHLNMHFMFVETKKTEMQ